MEHAADQGVCVYCGETELCVYCGETELTGDEKPEHGIPCAIGSEWTVPNVCNPCNEWAGAQVDQPFLREALIRELRHTYDVRDPRHPDRREASPFMHGRTEAGDWIVVDEDGTPRLHNPRTIDVGNGAYTIVAGSEEEYERRLNDLRGNAESIGWRVDGNDRPISIESHPKIAGTVKIQPWRWRREIAKVALAAGSTVFPASWRTSPDAGQLRHWMRDPKALPYEHCPFTQVRGTPLAAIAPPSRHALFFSRRPAGTILTIILFGDIAFTLPVETSGLPTPVTAWFSDPRRGRPGIIRGGQTTLPELLALDRSPEEQQ